MWGFLGLVFEFDFVFVGVDLDLFAEGGRVARRGGFGGDDVGGLDGFVRRTFTLKRREDGIY